MKKLIYSLFALFTLASCSSDNDILPGRGKIMARAESEITDQINIHIVSADNSGYDTTFTDINALNSTEFEIGQYIIQAFAGDKDTEGYCANYFFDEKTIEVTADQITSVNLTPKGQKAQIRIIPSDAFAHYMTAYSARVNKLDYDFSNPEPLYVLPGQVKVSVNYTLPSGKEFQYDAAEITAKASTIYTVNLDLNNGEMGSGSISVKIDDNLNREEIEIIPN